eukprot:NODE_669_length_4885_cov_0.982449.p3 type:complete len:306 gc:universal NODE_669_length_4885_cov_0.982449:2274-3191(+)
MPLTLIPLPNSLPFPIIQKYESKPPYTSQIIHKFIIKRHVDKDPQNSMDISFRSKVISRLHAELIYGSTALSDHPNPSKEYQWMIKDVGSSSGTFLNGKRISPPNTPSQYVALNHHDQLQFGVDYQQRHEDVYKSVKCKIELNQEYPLLNHTRYQELNQLIKSLYSITVVKNNSDDVRQVLNSQLLTEETEEDQLGDIPTDMAVDEIEKDHRDTQIRSSQSSDMDTPESMMQVPPILQNDFPTNTDNLQSNESNLSVLPECCICLQPLKLYHGLFISPCCHLFHYHCVRQLCVGHFLCPMYFNLM